MKHKGEGSCRSTSFLYGQNRNFTSHAPTDTYSHTHARTCTHRRTHARTHARTQTSTRTHTHTPTHPHTHTHTHPHTHTHTHSVTVHGVRSRDSQQPCCLSENERAHSDKSGRAHV